MKATILSRGLAALATLGLVFCAGQALAGSDDSRSSRFIRIGNGSVRPAVAQLRSGEPVGWINSSSGIAKVAFEPEVARSMVCDTAGSFRLDGHELRSSKIQARQFASMCRLAPGNYRYRIDLSSGDGTTGGNMTHRSLVGRIVVTP